jgi:hypothetical protein
MGCAESRTDLVIMRWNANQSRLTFSTQELLNQKPKDMIGTASITAKLHHYRSAILMYG